MYLLIILYEIGKYTDIILMSIIAIFEAITKRSIFNLYQTIILHTEDDK